ncbi:MAG: HIT domain-containing protein [Deltaproteobacteria bacterium]|nr:HIT domain-containing protein [Deltaproteobacteria bacterium]
MSTRDPNAALGTGSEAESDRTVLWAPWRMQYIEGEKAHDCVFCISPETAMRRERLILHCTPHSRVMLNKYPYNNGHLMIAPHRHTANLAELPDVEFTDLMDMLRRTVALLQEAMHPQGMNVGLNLGTPAGAGIADHLHWHVVPRWIGDTNFMPVVGSVHVMPQHLLDSYDLLHPYFTAVSLTTTDMYNQK